MLEHEAIPVTLVTVRKIYGAILVIMKSSIYDVMYRELIIKLSGWEAYMTSELPT